MVILVYSASYLVTDVSDLEYPQHRPHLPPQLPSSLAFGGTWERELELDLDLELELELEAV
jgi:hypothetical protein